MMVWRCGDNQLNLISFNHPMTWHVCDKRNLYIMLMIATVMPRFFSLNKFKDQIVWLILFFCFVFIGLGFREDI
jgi:hypothetical protein